MLGRSRSGVGVGVGFDIFRPESESESESKFVDFVVLLKTDAQLKKHPTRYLFLSRDIVGTYVIPLRVCEVINLILQVTSCYKGCPTLDLVCRLRFCGVTDILVTL